MVPRHHPRTVGGLGGYPLRNLTFDVSIQNIECNVDGIVKKTNITNKQHCYVIHFTAFLPTFQCGQPQLMFWGDRKTFRHCYIETRGGHIHGPLVSLPD